jgi:hypothetical protein
MSNYHALPESALYQRKSDGSLHPVEINKDLPVLRRAKFLGETCYIFEGNEVTAETVFYNVSSILRRTQDPKDREALRKWEIKVGQSEAMRIRNEAIGAGRATHTYLHAHLTGQPVPKIDRRYQLYFEALKEVLPHFGATLFSEQMVVNFKHKYFGIIDQLGLYRGSLTLSDLKTTLKPKTSLFWIQDKILQLAAYYTAVESLYPIDLSALIYLVSDGSHHEFIFTPEKTEQYKRDWLDRLSQVRQESDLAA